MTDETATAVAESLALLPEVAFAEPNGTTDIDGPTYPNDPLFTNGTQWGNWNFGQSGGTPNADVNAPEAWGVTTGGPLIAVIDRGVDTDHPDLAGHTIGDKFDPTEDELAKREHGTRVAGIIGATTNNGLGIAGMVWNASILSKRLGDDAEDVGVVRYAASHGAAILNNSWHLDPPGRNSTVVRLAFADAYKLNCVAVVAMGNTGVVTANRPAAFGQGIIAVGSTDRDDNLASNSTIGNHIDLVAPGVAITSTVLDDGYSSASGTSFAAPYVSGIAALLLALRPDLYNDDIEQIFSRSGDDLGAIGYDIEYGAGRANGRKALDLIRAPNSLQHSSGPAGGTIANVSGWIPMAFYSAPGLLDGYIYTVRRYEVHKQVIFLDPPPASVQLSVWGRGVATIGYSAEYPNWGLGWCEPVSVSHGGYTLRTYVYEVQIPFFLGGGLRWVPTDPDHVVYANTLLKVYPQPDIAQSFFVPEAGLVGTPLVGAQAVAFFRACPNNDGGSSLPNNARLKVVIRDSNGIGVAGIPAADIYVALNGGTVAQGFVGDGADSVIANTTWNPTCPNLRALEADGSTDATGTTYITFTGSTAGNPGLGVRNPLRKWGHYDSELAVFVRGVKMSGRFTEADAPGTYVLRIKNFDLTGGLGPAVGLGEAVTSADFASIANNMNDTGPLSYWRDLDSSGAVNSTDFSIISGHPTHDCDTPLNP